MTPTFIHRRVSRAIALRLFAGLLPSILALGLVAGLFYYGQWGRAAPLLILLAAAVLTVIAVAIAWTNAGYFAGRIARLAATTDRASGVQGSTNEFERIERAVGSLGSALSAAEEERAKTDAMAAARLREEATMLAAAVNDSIAQLDQIRLPLQILLESPFGDLNDNQEELLRDARAAADAIDSSLRRLAQLADIDRGEFHVQRELVQVNDVVRSVLPLARAAAERKGARIDTVLEPGLPRVRADRARLAESLALFVSDAAASATAEHPLVIATNKDGRGATIRIAPADTAKDLPILASRLITAQGGQVRTDDGALVIRVGD